MLIASSRRARSAGAVGRHSSAPAIVTGVVAALVVAALVAGCGSGAPGDDPTGDLAGRTFLSDSVTEGGVDRPLVTGSQIRLTFGSDDLGAQAGCNTMSGQARLAGQAGAQRLEVDGPLASTQMACEPALMDQDTWLGGILTSSPEVVLRGASLTLTSGDTVVQLTDRTVADPDRPLASTLWTLDGIVSESSVSSVPAGVTSTLQVSADETRLQVDTGCNTGGADVSVSPTTLRIGPMALTTQACEGPAAGVEADVTAVLTGTVSYEVTGPSLAIDNGENGLLYRAD